jgi:23S rRNA-/tRNA-specific pseudouridylate synthase
VGLGYVVQNGDHIIHETLRKETPVLSEMPAVLHEDEEFIAFNKPSSMPVHPCGNFMQNTLIKIAEAEMGFDKLKTVHRLDRQTSGIVFFAKKESSSNDFREALLNCRV